MWETVLQKSRNKSERQRLVKFPFPGTDCKRQQKTGKRRMLSTPGNLRSSIPRWNDWQANNQRSLRPQQPQEVQPIGGQARNEAADSASATKPDTS